MRDGPLSIDRNTNEANGIETMKLTGPLTLGTLFELQEALREDPKEKTILDLSEVPYIDSAGLGALLSFHASCNRTGRRYAIAGVPPRVHTMFAASKVEKLICISPTPSDAEAFLSQ